jgi:hypothetical protein
VSASISPQVRILALIGLLAAVALGAGTFLLRGSGTSRETPPTAHVVRRVPPHTTVRTHAPLRHAAKVPHASGRHGNRVYAQLPRPLRRKLAHHRVVVVSFYNPRSDVDAISLAEARAGAIAAGAGFLPVSVLDNRVAGILTGLLPGGGLLPEPGVLVYRAPGRIELRIDGFADRRAVEQAARNVLAGQSGPVTTSTTPAS